MMDFNASAHLSDRLTALIDAGLARNAEPARMYLGASRLGGPCERAIQYEYAGAPVDSDRELDGRMRRIFARGHAVEALMVRWLTDAGFSLHTRDGDGEQFGFTAAGGRLQGHVDGVLTGGPEDFAYPCLWENKCVQAKTWQAMTKTRLAVSEPAYAAQVALYQAYMKLADHPALFTAVCADMMEVHAEAVPFDAGLAQRTSDRAVRILQATEAGELLPRPFKDRAHFVCRQCAWQDRCWRPS